jgi:hypothetical protein
MGLYKFSVLDKFYVLEYVGVLVVVVACWKRKILHLASCLLFLLFLFFFYSRNGSFGQAPKTMTDRAANNSRNGTSGYTVQEQYM